jgi:hypothetical protein
MVTAEGPYSDNVTEEFRKLARAEEALIKAIRAALKDS